MTVTASMVTLHDGYFYVPVKVTVKSIQVLCYRTNDYLEGDQNHDGVVDTEDIGLVNYYYGKSEDDYPDWDYRADVCPDRVCDSTDTAIVSYNNGHTGTWSTDVNTLTVHWSTGKVDNVPADGKLNIPSGATYFYVKKNGVGVHAAVDFHDTEVPSAAWHNVEQWMLTLRNQAWFTAENWMFSTHTLKWFTIEQWLLTVRNPIWNFAEQWILTLKNYSWFPVETWTLQLGTGMWNLVEEWILIMRNQTWFTVETWLTKLIIPSWHLIEQWMLQLGTGFWNTIETWTLVIRNPYWNFIETWLLKIGMPPQPPLWFQDPKTFLIVATVIFMGCFLFYEFTKWRW